MQTSTVFMKGKKQSKKKIIREQLPLSITNAHKLYSLDAQWPRISFSSISPFTPKSVYFKHYNWFMLFCLCLSLYPFKMCALKKKTPKHNKPNPKTKTTQHFSLLLPSMDFDFNILRMQELPEDRWFFFLFLDSITSIITMCSLWKQ